jgi:hypothetical protein
MIFSVGDRIRIKTSHSTCGVIIESEPGDPSDSHRVVWDPPIPKAKYSVPYYAQTCEDFFELYDNGVEVFMEVL